MINSSSLSVDMLSYFFTSWTNQWCLICDDWSWVSFHVAEGDLPKETEGKERVPNALGMCSWACFIVWCLRVWGILDLCCKYGLVSGFCFKLCENWDEWIQCLCLCLWKSSWKGFQCCIRLYGLVYLCSWIQLWNNLHISSYTPVVIMFIGKV